MDLGIFQFIQVSPSKLPAGKELLSGKELLAGNDPFPKNNLQKMAHLAKNACYRHNLFANVFNNF